MQLVTALVEKGAKVNALGGMQEISKNTIAVRIDLMHGHHCQFDW